MKKLLAILCLLCVSVSTFAFAEENTIVFGGTEPTYLRAQCSGCRRSRDSCS